MPEELLKLVVAVKGVERITLITDSMRAAGMPDGPSKVGSLTGGQDVIVDEKARHATLTKNGIEKVENPVHAILTGKCQDIVGTSVQPQVVRGIHIAGYRAHHGIHLAARKVEIAVVVAKGHCKGYPPVHQRLEYGTGALLRRLAEYYVAGMDHEIRLLGIQHLDYIAEGPLRALISHDIMGIGELKYLELAIFPIFEGGSNPGSLAHQAKLHQGQAQGSCYT